MTLDPWQELWIAGIKTLDPFEKNCGVGKKQLCRIMKSMLVGWKLWIRNKIFYFIAPFLTLLRMVFQNNSDPYWSNSWLARLSPLFHDANHHRYKAVGRRLINELTQIPINFLWHQMSEELCHRDLDVFFRQKCLKIKLPPTFST